VRAVRQERPGTLTYELESPGRELPFRPGQFTMAWAWGVGEAPLSISGDPARPERLVHTVRAVGGVTEALCATAEGDTWGIRGPYGQGWPLEQMEGRELIFASAGLGLAPLRPALHHALARRESYGRLTLLYGARNPDRLLFPGELEEWRESEGLEVVLSVGEAGSGWPGEIGMVTEHVCGLDCAPANASALICSSEGLMQGLAAELMELGLEPENIHVSLERNMQCGLGLCGRCQLGPVMVCRDGPVFAYPQVADLLAKEEL
jgi:NAD(P)H-flavin reductase